MFYYRVEYKLLFWGETQMRQLSLILKAYIIIYKRRDNKMRERVGRGRNGVGDQSMDNKTIGGTKTGSKGGSTQGLFLYFKE